MSHDYVVSGTCHGPFSNSMLSNLQCHHSEGVCVCVGGSCPSRSGHAAKYSTPTTSKAVKLRVAGVWCANVYFCACVNVSDSFLAASKTVSGNDRSAATAGVGQRAPFPHRQARRGLLSACALSFGTIECERVCGCMLACMCSRRDKKVKSLEFIHVNWGVPVLELYRYMCGQVGRCRRKLAKTRTQEKKKGEMLW